MIIFQGKKRSSQVGFIPWIEGWFGLRQSNDVIYSDHKQMRKTVIHFMAARNTADNIKYLSLMFGTPASKIGWSAKVIFNGGTPKTFPLNSEQGQNAHAHNSRYYLPVFRNLIR